jgi:hypothetical protein
MRRCNDGTDKKPGFVKSTRLLPFGDNKITPFLTNVSFDVAAIC